MPKSAPEEFRRMAARHNGKIKLWIEQAADQTVSTEEERLKELALAKLGMVDRIRASLAGFEAPDAGLCAAITYAWVLANLRGQRRAYRADFDSGKIPDRFVGSQQALQVKNERYVEREKQEGMKEIGMYGAVWKQLQDRLDELTKRIRLPGADVAALKEELAEITDRMNRIGPLISTSSEHYSQQSIDAEGPLAEDALTSTPIFTAASPTTGAPSSPPWWTTSGRTRASTR